MPVIPISIRQLSGITGGAASCSAASPAHSRAVARFVDDSPLERNGFELSVPREISSAFEAYPGGADRQTTRHITRALVGLNTANQWMCSAASKEPPSIVERRRPRRRRWRGIAELKVRIHSAPAESQVQTCLSREFAFLGREAAVFRGCPGRDERPGVRQRHAGAGISGRAAVISLSGPIPVPHRRR